MAFKVNPFLTTSSAQQAAASLDVTLSKFKALTEEATLTDDTASLRSISLKMQTLFLPQQPPFALLRQQQESLLNKITQRAALQEKLIATKQLATPQTTTTTITVPVFSTTPASPSITVSLSSAQPNPTSSSTPSAPVETAPPTQPRSKLDECTGFFWDRILVTHNRSDKFDTMHQIRAYWEKACKESKAPSFLIMNAERYLDSLENTWEQANQVIEKSSDMLLVILQDAITRRINISTQYREGKYNTLNYNSFRPIHAEIDQTTKDRKQGLISEVECRLANIEQETKLYELYDAAIQAATQPAPSVTTTTTTPPAPAPLPHQPTTTTTTPSATPVFPTIEPPTTKYSRFDKLLDQALEPYKDLPIFAEMDGIRNAFLKEWNAQYMTEFPHAQQDKEPFQKLTQDYFTFLGTSPSLVDLQENNETLVYSLMKMTRARFHQMKTDYTTQKSIDSGEAFSIVKGKMPEVCEEYSKAQKDFRNKLISKAQYHLVWTKYYRVGCQVLDNMLLGY